MVIYYCLYLLVLGGLIIAGLGDARWRQLLYKIYVPILLVILLLFASLRSPTVDRDYGNYLPWFNYIAAGGLTPLDWVKDPGFVLVSELAAALGMGYVGATFVLVALALGGATRFAWLACNERLISIFIYLAFCRYFLTHEMTAIRVGVAIPLLSLSILYMYRGRKLPAVILFLLGAAFHISALLGLPILLLARRGVLFKSRWWVGWMIPAAFILRIFARNILNIFSQIARFSVYISGTVDTASINYFSIYLIAHILVIVSVVCFFWVKMSCEERLFVFCSGIGLFIQLLLSFNDVLALRCSDVFGLFDVMLFIIPIKHIKSSLVYSYLFALVVLGFLVYVSTLSIVQPYHWIFV